MAVHPPHGPFKIGANRQITIPAELLKRIDLAPGDSVYVAMAEDIEGALTVVPVERVVRWIDAGRRSGENEPHVEPNPRRSRPRADLTPRLARRAWLGPWRRSVARRRQRGR